MSFTLTPGEEFQLRPREYFPIYHRPLHNPEFAHNGYIDPGNDFYRGPGTFNPYIIHLKLYPGTFLLPEMRASYLMLSGVSIRKTKKEMQDRA